MHEGGLRCWASSSAVRRCRDSGAGFSLAAEAAIDALSDLAAQAWPAAFRVRRAPRQAGLPSSQAGCSPRPAHRHRRPGCICPGKAWSEDDHVCSVQSPAGRPARDSCGKRHGPLARQLVDDAEGDACAVPRAQPSSPASLTARRASAGHEPCGPAMAAPPPVAAGGVQNKGLAVKHDAPDLPVRNAEGSARKPPAKPRAGDAAPLPRHA
jgi:hypothetical protein